MPNEPASPPRPPRLPRRARRSACSPRYWTTTEHAAEHALPWAINALGPVPGHPVDRLDWQRRASSIGAYRGAGRRHTALAHRLQPDPQLACNQTPSHRLNRHNTEPVRRPTRPATAIEATPTS